MPPPPPAIHVSDISTNVSGAGHVQWKEFFRITLPLAAVAGLLTALAGFLGWLFVIGSVFFAIHRYRRRQSGPLTATQGAKLGIFTSVLSCAFFAVFFSLRVAANPAEFRAALDKASQQMAAFKLNPESTQMAQEMFAGTRGMVLFAASTIIFTLLFLVILGAVSGALAARPARNKPGS